MQRGCTVNKHEEKKLGELVTHTHTHTLTLPHTHSHSHHTDTQTHSQTLTHTNILTCPPMSHTEMITHSPASIHWGLNLPHHTHDILNQCTLKEIKCYGMHWLAGLALYWFSIRDALCCQTPTQQYLFSYHASLSHSISTSRSFFPFPPSLSISLFLSRYPSLSHSPSPPPSLSLLLSI